MNKGYNYVNITIECCKGWLNLFFNDECICRIENVELADQIRDVTHERVDHLPITLND